jgi:phage repressor protein C with HTH and peptisase S24 domain
MRRMIYGIPFACQRQSVPECRNHSRMETIGSRIRAARTAAGIQPKVLAKNAGIAYSTLMDLENGRSKSSAALHRIALALGTTPQFLETGKVSPAEREHVPPPYGLQPIQSWDSADDLDPSIYVTLNRIELYLSAGNGGPDPDAAEMRETGMAFRSDFLRAQGWRPETHFVLRAHGASMEPTIQDRSPVVVDTTQRNIQSGRVYAVVLNGESYLKRLDKLPNGRIRLRSDNPSPMFAPIDVAADEIEIIGRAVWTPTLL